MKRYLFGGALALALCLSCATAAKPVPQDLSSSALVQRAQEASDAYNYVQATAYYQALIDRYGSDPAMVAQGKYEIAFIYYKEGKYPEAKALFDGLLALYKGADAAALPARYRILAEKVLPEVEAKLTAAATAKTTKK